MTPIKEGFTFKIVDILNDPLPNKVKRIEDVVAPLVSIFYIQRAYSEFKTHKSVTKFIEYILQKCE